MFSDWCSLDWLRRQPSAVGKTSIVCNLAAMSAASGLRTLVVDLDPQANSTHYLLGNLEEAERDALRAFELDPGLEGAGALLLTIFAQQGRTEEAVRSFEEAHAVGARSTYRTNTS